MIHFKIESKNLNFFENLKAKKLNFKIEISYFFQSSWRIFSNSIHLMYEFESKVELFNAKSGLCLAGRQNRLKYFAPKIHALVLIVAANCTTL